MWTEAHLWIVLSAPLVGAYACASAVRATSDVSSHMNFDSWARAASAAMAALAAAASPSAIEALASVVLVAALIYLAAYDLRAMAVPIWPTTIMIFLGLGAAAAQNGWSGLFVHMATGLVAWTIFRMIGVIHARLCGRSGLGAGDALIAALLGAWLGYQQLAWSIAVGAGLALVWLCWRRWPALRPFPFAPGLALGTYLVLIGGRAVWLL